MLYYYYPVGSRQSDCQKHFHVVTLKVCNVPFQPCSGALLKTEVVIMLQASSRRQREEVPSPAAYYYIIHSQSIQLLAAISVLTKFSVSD